MPADKARAHRHAGFSLIELVTVIAIIGILMLVATPNFLAFRKNSELTTAINSLSSSLSMARTEAIRRSNSTRVAPAAAGGWADGWKATVVSDSTALDQQQPIATYADDVTISSNGFPDAGVTFNGDGYPAPGSGALPFVIVMTNGTRSRRLTLQPSGQVRVCDPGAAVKTSGFCG